MKKEVIKFLGNIIFLDSLLLKNSKKIGLVKVEHKKRYSGSTTYSIRALFSLSFDMIVNYHFLPLRPGSLVGVVAKFFVIILKFPVIRKTKQFEIKSKTF